MNTLLSPAESQTPNIAASRPIGTIMRMASGRVRLSYCAASTRKTSSSASGNTQIPELPAMNSW